MLGALAVVLVTAGSGDDAGSDGPARGKGRATFVADGTAEVGGTVPDFTLPGLDGGTVALSDYAGTPVMVNFWASWCHPCREEFPLFEAAREKYAKEGLAIVGVSYQDIASDARAFVADQGAGWDFARDPGGRLAAAFGVRALPQTFFVDADGKIVDRQFGITSAEDLDKEIRTILPASSKG